MQSMTGYGSSSLKNTSFDLNVSLKSVNGRFLEVKFHSPKEYAPLERDLKKMISKYIHRGTVDVYIHKKKNLSQTSSQIVVNKELAKQYHKAFLGLAKDLKIGMDLSIKDFVLLPIVSKDEREGSLAKGESKHLLETVEKSLSALRKSRAKEGKALKTELQLLLRNLSKIVALITRQRSSIIKSYEARLKSRLLEFDQKINVDPQRVAQELVIYLDKSDIREELTRLKEHIKNCQALILGKATMGKKLDFYSQELLREVNTVGSKSQDSGLTQEVVNAKSIIESFREQVQNVE